MDEIPRSAPIRIAGRPFLAVGINPNKSFRGLVLMILVSGEALAGAGNRKTDLSALAELFLANRKGLARVIAPLETPPSGGATGRYVIFGIAGPRAGS